jgi:hypothetical protein
MEWIRQVSLVRRVMIGFVLMGVIVLSMGAAASWFVQGLAADAQSTDAALRASLTERADAAA